MIDAWMKIPDPGRAAIAVLLCVGLFVSDLATPVEMNEAQLYPVALLPLYRVRSKLLLWIAATAAAGLAGLGYVLDPPPDFWDGATNRMFSIIVVLVTALAMTKLAEYEHRLLMESITDPLTGLLNRRRFTELSTREVTRSRRHQLVFSVLMIDIDHFKRINDTYGHPVGDLAIKALAEVCTNALRPHDLLARFGGEEFVLTLPQTESDGAHIVAERIRATTEAIEVPTDQGTVRFTVSIGISTYLTGLPFERIVERADEALYKAKQSGRNRVVILPVDDATAGMAPAH
jgi:diguanylate cyclase (GGDEF)-like protein